MDVFQLPFEARSKWDFGNEAEWSDFAYVDDVCLAVEAFGSDLGHPRWNPMADLNRDGRVRVDDIVTIALNFGEGPFLHFTAPKHRV